METLLKDFLLIFGLATGVLLLCHRLHLATTVGLLVTGILVGPNGFGLISATHEVEVLAEIGVVLLLFTIGIEFSMESLLRIKRYVIFGGAFQVPHEYRGGVPELVFDGGHEAPTGRGVDRRPDGPEKQEGGETGFSFHTVVFIGRFRKTVRRENG